MTVLTALDLARIQFGFTISFHIIFPAITIGLASYLMVLEGLWLWKKQEVYRDLYHFWKNIFAVTFAMGVVSGLVMSYEFGTNWSYFSAFAGGITGPLLAYEVLTAFFLEAGFLGIMLFGWKKVGPGLHFLATVMVATGTLISTFWILASNSWMQTPQGYEILDGRAIPVDWLSVIFNPSFPYRLIQMTVAAFLTSALIIGASGAWHLLKGHNNIRVRTMFSMAMWLILIVAPVQIFIGDLHGLNTLKYQPAKIAAIEGHWENTPGERLPFIVFGLPDMKAEKTLYKIEIPAVGGLMLTHELNGVISGLKDFLPEDRPNATIIFWSFRIMVAMGFLMLLLGVWSVILRKKQRLYASRYFHYFALAMAPAGLVAILMGWITTEVGRQPWVVYGIMRTKDAVSHHSVMALSITLLVFIVVYFCVFGLGAVYMMKLIGKGPSEHSDEEDTEDKDLLHKPARPLSATPNNSNLLDDSNQDKGV